MAAKTFSPPTYCRTDIFISPTYKTPLLVFFCRPPQLIPQSLSLNPPMNPSDQPSSSRPPPPGSDSPINDQPISELSEFFKIHSYPSSSSSSFIPAMEVPQPLECLQLGTVVVPPFLSKTYDLVEESSLDMIISWGKNGRSFVVWDPMEFGRSILPRNFKHNNFSSFVRQLNTYGFHKIDTDKWEFANEFFRKGKRHLLSNIQRRRTNQTASSGSRESKPGLESEVERLKSERSSMLQEVIELQQQQQGTVQHIGLMGKKLQAAEQKQKKMVSFLARLVQNAAFLTRLDQNKEGQRTQRKFVKQRQQLELGCSTNPDYLLEDSKIAHGQGQVMGREEDTTKGKNVENYQPDEEYDLVSFLPASSSEEKSLYQELLDWPEIENAVTTTQEANPWSLEANDIWDNNNNNYSNNFEAAEFDSDIWNDLDHLQVEEPPVEGEFNNSYSYYYKKMDP